MHLPVTQIELLKEYFKDKPVLKVYLFGSYARGEADEASDIDLLVDLDANHYDLAWAYLEMREELPVLMNKKVDFATKLSKYIVENVNKDKILIYEKQKHEQPLAAVAH
jgi:uncharacterized protein